MKKIFEGIDENIIIKCFDDNFQVVGFIDEFRSLAWRYSWSGIGNWTLIADLTSTHTVDVIRKSSFIMIQNVPSLTFLSTENKVQAVWGYIEAYKTQNKPSGDTLTVSGSELKGLARRRIIRTKETYPSESRAVMAKLLENQLINPVDSKRKIAGLVDNTTYCKSTATTEAPEQYTNLGDNLVNIAEAAELGWAAGIVDNEIHWYIADGKNRVYGQHDNAPMLLDFTQDTLNEANYDIMVDSQNVSYIGGKGEGDNRKIKCATTEDAEPEGLHRYEIFTDARNEAEEDLEGKGIEALNEYSGKTTVKLVPSFAFLQRFGTTYNLGDVGTFFLPNGNTLNLRLTEAELTYENNGVNASFVFGYDKKTIKKTLHILLRSYKNMLNQ